MGSPKCRLKGEEGGLFLPSPQPLKGLIPPKEGIHNGQGHQKKDQSPENDGILRPPVWACGIRGDPADAHKKDQEHAHQTIQEGPGSGVQALW